MDSELKPSSIRFLADSTEGKDGAKEVIMDYVISWMLRCAQTGCCESKPILHQYCRKFLSCLIKKELTDNDVVIVETWKQYKRIDLWAWVKVGDEEFDIIIEDKYYTGVHDDQLKRYKNNYEDWKLEKGTSSKAFFWLLNCFDNKESTHIFDAVIEEKIFDVLFWDDMLEKMELNKTYSPQSESDIFNEFWFEEW